MYFLIFILLIFSHSNCININNDFRESLDDENTIQIEPGLSETYFIEYQQNTKFSFNIKDNDNLQINIHAINCNFKIDYIGEMLNQKNLDTYSLLINSTNNITITPLIDVIDGEYKENYAKKSCPLIINSFLVNNNTPNLIINNT